MYTIKLTQIAEQDSKKAKSVWKANSTYLYD